MSRFIDRVKALFETSKTGGAHGADPLDYGQFIHLDAEDLAEQGILSAYTALLPKLAEYTATHIDATEEIDDERGSYAVQANGKRYQIWDPAPQNGDGWERATVAFFEIVNANLRDTTHTFYALYGGNDLGGMFLTEGQFAAARRALVKRSEWPWLPRDEPPHFGYPVDRKT